MDQVQKDTSASAYVERDALAHSHPTSLEEPRIPQGIYRLPAVFLLALCIPTSANIRVAEPVYSMSPSYLGARVFRKEEEPLGIGTYSPCYEAQLEDVGPLRIPVARYVRAKIRFLGDLTPLPLREDT